ncbi:uncharacterized protein LOC134246881 [Saccostrea cucullata]|uniref:uncharacterized protein LOC134246881 n=1 Tax=Saccostrea cuccullata TaxID=36930 RepID=UPI002ECFFA62
MSIQVCSLDQLKEHCNLSSHNHNNDELYTIAGSLTSTKMTKSKCRQHVAEFEEKHLFYFSLFKPKVDDASKTWMTRVKEDIRNVKRSGFAPTLREIYAVCEIINTIIFLLFEGHDNTIKAWKIQPVIRENETEKQPLILLFISHTEGLCFQRIEVNVDYLDGLDIETINANHAECLDKRFRNDFKDLQGNFKLRGQDNFTSSIELTEEQITPKTNVFSLCSQIIYGNKVYAQAVKECVKMHMEQEDFRDVYMHFVDVKSYVSEDEYNGMESISDSKRKEKFRSKLMKKAFEKHLKRWQYFTIEEFFAIASVFNIEVFVMPVQTEGTLSENDTKGTKFFLPICGSYLFTFKTPLVFQKRYDESYKAILVDQECLCLTSVPEVFGNFPIVNDEIDLRRVKKLDIKSCCPSLGRHGRHRHFEHLWNHDEPEGKIMQESRISKYFTPMNKHIEIIHEIMAEEGKTIDAINGGKGTLQMCISKEIYDEEDARIPVSLPVDDVQKSFENVADWTGIPVYVFSYSEKVFQWVSISPKKCNPTRRSKCRYYMTILYNRESGYFDRIVPKNGCNCLQVHPYVASLQTELIEVGNCTVPSKKCHWSLLTFLPEKPKDEMFTDDTLHEMRVIPMYSEILLIMERKDMQDRFLDKMSDYAYSLYRCISKEIFGNEEQFRMIMKETVKEIKENPGIFGHLLMTEKEISDSDFLENFRYRKHRTFDFFRSHKKVVEESAHFFADRIEDGMNLGDLELFAVATLFQVPIYVLIAEINENKVETKWVSFTQIWRKRQPSDFAARIQYFAGKEDHKCEFDPSSGSKYYVTLYRTFSGDYHRIVPKDQVCNCLKEPPQNILEEHKHHGQPDFRIYFEMHNIKSKLTIAKLQLDNWVRCNMALEIFCTEIIDVLEGRRQNVNISNIVGSSVGLVGSALAIGGLIAAPFTAGVSLGLIVAGGVIGTLGSFTVMGSKVTEFILSKDAISMLERYQMNLRERSRCMENSLSDLQQEMTRTFLIHGGLPVIIGHVILRAVTIANSVLPPLSVILDVGVLAYTISNMKEGSKTNVTERLRKVRSVLRTTRIQMFTWGYGNQKNYMEAMKNLKFN